MNGKMPKVCADLSEIEYGILKKLTIVEGDDGEKLKNLLRFYIHTLPELKSSEYALRRIENKKEIEENLQNVWDVYEYTDYPTENWGEDMIDKLAGDLIEINVLVKTGERQFLPSNKFRSLFKMLLHDVATENKDIDEYSAACIATIQLLMESGMGTLSKETIRDGTIFINEGWMFEYAIKLKEAREFMRTRRLFPGIEVPKTATA
ncbi:hypothetical protein MNV_1740032 [Candidatus Methanoperedens nitroreducens]|uniref:Uncharacterized protein n=2 Tax=Candidatus Methanoperedens nitratireducens TaxID=1392998 RepID=A0A284VM54_9EURY|nr:hypothetical protein MNV_1740032 [Candidatus Methanoperedens nitroreducens]